MRLNKADALIDLFLAKGMIAAAIYAERMLKSEERTAESAQNVPNDELISEKAEIEALMKEFKRSPIELLPAAQPEWNNHTVACLLAELFDDPCACNYNGIDEWLPEKCEVIDACPHPVGVACWEQYLKHRTERRTDEQTD